MTRADLEEMVEAQLPEFYKMLLGDAEIVVMHQSGLSDDEIALLGAAVKLAGHYDKDVTVIARSGRTGHQRSS
jgi:hypothetical protein